MDAKIATLNDRAVLRVSGTEASSFLHNIVTADIAGLSDGDATYAGLLTPQGKVLFDFLVIRRGDAFLIDCASEQANSLLQRLAIYKLRSKVEISRIEDVQVHAAWGREPQAAWVVYADPRDAHLGWRIIGAAIPNVEPEEYHRRRIELGIADSMSDIGSGEIFPHEANMDQLGGINFKKGCYVGQEVVSRMQHRGTARTRFLIAQADGDMTEHTEISAEGRRIGEMKSVSGRRGLALVRIDRAARAMADGVPITCGGVELTLTVPEWATFTLEHREDAED